MTREEKLERENKALLSVVNGIDTLLSMYADLGPTRQSKARAEIVLDGIDSCMSAGARLLLELDFEEVSEDVIDGDIDDAFSFEDTDEYMSKDTTGT